ncbi:MAG: hypothetical protein O2857_27145 [Planctomycetota bacterium]|nr:hypothetical protein [Planctomycetota bacterium]
MKRPFGIRTIGTCLLWAFVPTAVSMLFERQWCVGTPGWGFPLEVVHVLYEKAPKTHYVFEPFFLLFDLLFWGLVLYPIAFFRTFIVWRRNRVTEDAEQRRA